VEKHPLTMVEGLAMQWSSSSLYMGQVFKPEYASVFAALQKMPG